MNWIGTDIVRNIQKDTSDSWIEDQYIQLMYRRKKKNVTHWTIDFYVDNNEISHKDPKVVMEIIDILNEKFEKLTIYKGKGHTLLGMKLRMRGYNNIYNEMKDQRI